MSKFLCIPRLKTKELTHKDIKSRIREIKILRLKIVSKDSKFQERNSRALRSLITILRESKRSELQLVSTRDIISCSVTLLSHYEEKLHRTEGGFCDWRRRRDYKIALFCYNEILRSFIPEKTQEIVNSLVEVMHKEKLWHWEHLCWELSRGLLQQGVGGSPFVDALLDFVENEMTGFYDARAIVRILYEILDVYTWSKDQRTVSTIERLLKLYYASLSGNKTDDVPPYAPLRRGDNTSDVTILDFGSTLEYAAYMHDTRLYKDTLTSNIFPVLMRMIASTNRLVSLLGNRVIHHLLDRHENRTQFDTPKIFFENMSFDLRVSRYDKQDKHFLQVNRQILHDSLVHGIMKHSAIRLNLESVYCTICLIAVEVPCGFTAAALVCLVMNLQDLTLEQSDLSRHISCHIHATVIAIMSLLCWIHEAKVFYTCVNKIMMQRAQWAPHLNPPIKPRYRFAIHHVLWDKPEFFFVDWEARYGLWKCFRLREEHRRITDDSLNKNS
ncbi:uncharacterized protein [Venturia canescens]|uniref:uncharacterized protein isoform X2 n=1 Tax=Venturia canescens TaxID=32260 RepID=UPI001C9C36A7|nr:uncharacterized protein LOC122410050 isoform X2 [Venturia canescens]